MSLIKYVGCTTVGICLGLFGGIKLGQYVTKPVAIYERNVEGDLREFMVLDEPMNRSETPFVRSQGSRGPFVRLDALQEEQSAEETAKTNELIQKLISNK